MLFLRMITPHFIEESRMSMGKSVAVFLLTLSLGFYGCSSGLPETYRADDNPGGTLKGKVYAVAADGDSVFVATGKGFFLKKSGQSWSDVSVPGFERTSIVTSLALRGEEMFIGTRGEGLFVFNGQAWEVVNARYGGLPDDYVNCLAIDRENDGLPGQNVWVGTDKGLAVRRDGRWEVYTPGGNWLTELAGESSDETDGYHVSSGFRVGAPGEDKNSFFPPVTAISVGKNRIVFGSSRSMLAIVDEGVFATMVFSVPLEIVSLLVDPNAIWCGTDKGLLWGGLSGQAKGKPYPSWHGSVAKRSTIYGSKDSREFEYVFFRVGMNTARVIDLVRDNDDGLWVGYNGGPAGKQKRGDELTGSDGIKSSTPTSGVRRYVSIEEYIAKKKNARYEVYGGSYGIKGRPTALTLAENGMDVWIGTADNLQLLRK
jgi:ligand-binding sensor domain-containing protein